MDVERGHPRQPGPLTTARKDPHRSHGDHKLLGLRLRWERVRLKCKYVLWKRLAQPRSPVKSLPCLQVFEELRRIKLPTRMDWL